MFPQFKRCSRGNRHNHEIIHVKDFLHFVAYEPPHLLRLRVVGVVVAGAQDECSQQNSALHLLAETPGAGLLVQRMQVVRHGTPVSVPDPIVAGKVRTGLRCRENVIGG